MTPMQPRSRNPFCTLVFGVFLLGLTLFTSGTAEAQCTSSLCTSYSSDSASTVSWSSVPGATEYEVQVASDSGFTSPLSSGWVAGTSRTFALADGTWFVRRRAVRGRIQAEIALAEPGALDASTLTLPAERALLAGLEEAGAAAKTAVAEEKFEAAMAALARLRAPLDKFFEDVLVNDPNAELRKARLLLLARIRNALHEVADFSRIEG